MKEEQGLEAFETTLDQAVRQMRELEQRLKAGEEVSEVEIDAIAKALTHGKQLTRPELGAAIERAGK